MCYVHEGDGRGYTDLENLKLELKDVRRPPHWCPFILLLTVVCCVLSIY
jgi:hypothetical protein